MARQDIRKKLSVVLPVGADIETWRKEFDGRIRTMELELVKRNMIHEVKVRE